VPQSLPLLTKDELADRIYDTLLALKQRRSNGDA